MADTVENIDELIAYIESPEYLRMVAQTQGESPYSLLGSEFPYVEPEEEEEDSPAQIVFENLDTPPLPSAFGIRWNRSTQMCECQGCRERRTPVIPLVRRSFLRVHDSAEAYAEVLGRPHNEFQTRGNLNGYVDVQVGVTPGQLQDKAQAAYALWLADQNVIDYVIYSYRTPIAWHVTTSQGVREWIYPDVRYSRTTSGHQNKIRAALRLLTENVRVIPGD
jgi:hypothetical protein